MHSNEFATIGTLIIARNPVAAKPKGHRYKMKLARQHKVWEREPKKMILYCLLVQLLYQLKLKFSLYNTTSVCICVREPNHPSLDLGIGTEKILLASNVRGIS